MLSQWIKRQDTFGNPVTFTFQGNKGIKTLPGGVISLIAKICVLTFLSLRIKAIYDQSASSDYMFMNYNVITDPNHYTL